MKSSLFRWFALFIIPKKAILILSFILICITILPLVGITNITFYDNIIYSYWGYGIGQYDIISLLKLLITDFLPIYFICVYLSNNYESKQSFFIVRLGSKRTWLLHFIFTTYIYILAYVIASFIIIFLYSLLFSNGLLGVLYFDGLMDQDENELFYCALWGVIGRFFEISVLHIILLCIYSLFRNMAVAFFGAISLYIPLLIDFSFKYYPFGLSSVQRIFLSEDILPIFITKSLLIFFSISIICFLYLWYKGVYRIIEKG